MSSDEHLDDRSDRSALDAPDSLGDVGTKKKKSFHPIRSLRRFFAHGNGGSRHRPSNISDNSVLLKASSTTDVVVGTEVPKADTSSGNLQKQSKQISISADSVFSGEKSSEACHRVSLMSSEIVPPNSCNLAPDTSLIQHTSDVDGLCQSVVTKPPDLFDKNRLKQSSKFLDSAENEKESEEDFFKDRWMVSSNLSLCKRENTDSTDEEPKDIDLSIVRRNSSLTSSAAVHRLAIRPRGKRASSIHHQKPYDASSSTPLLPVIVLPLVREESSASRKGGKETDKGRFGCVDTVANWSDSFKDRKSAELDRVQGDQDRSDEMVECTAPGPSAGKDVLTSGLATTATAAEPFPRISKVDETESTMFDAAELNDKRFHRKTEDISADSHEEQAKEEPRTKIDKIGWQRSYSPSDASVDDMLDSIKPLQTVEPAELLTRPVSNEPRSVTPDAAGSDEQQLSTTASGVIMRSRPAAQVVVPSTQELLESAARRQTCAFPSDTEFSVDKQVTKRSSVILPATEAADSELAQMFSKFQRRSSQRKQNEETQSKKAGPSESVGRKEEQSSRTIGSSKAVGTDQKIRSEGGTSGSPPARVESASGDRNAGDQENVACSAAKKNGNVEGVTRAERSKSRYLPVVESVKPTKARSKTEARGVESTENNNNNDEKRARKTFEQSGETITDSKTGVGFSPQKHLSEDKAKSVKKSYSISYKTTPAAVATSAIASSGNKTRCSSQSEMVEEPATAVTPKSSASQAFRRGSLTYTNPKAGGYVPVSDNSSGKNVSDNAGGAKDARQFPAVSSPAQRSLRQKASSSAAVGAAASTRSGAVTHNAPVSLSTSSVSTSCEAVAPPAASSIPKIISPRAVQGAVKSANSSTELPKNAESDHRHGATPSALTKEPKESCVPVGSSESDPSKSTRPVRPAGGARGPRQKILPDDESTVVVEWMGMVQQKMKAWKDGQMEGLEKTSCK